MNKRDSFLQNLPIVDDNREIQTNSFTALNNFLPSDKFCLRDERIEDYGVDASLEIIEKGKATNFRAQIQLKGTRSIEPNRDGSYSLQVDTSNLNYLLNNPLSIYILYIEPQKQFRFVWARDEFQRLSKENPKWLEQKTITLRFNDILDSAILNEIKEQIIKQSSLHREVNEILILARPSRVSIEINSETFEITDKKVILNWITSFGINLVNEGYRREIINEINFLDSEDREKPSVLTVKAYAEYYSGHYHTSKEIITLLKISNQELSNEDKQIINWLESACDYRLGNINSIEHTERLAEILKVEDVEKFSSIRFNYIHQLLLNEEDSSRRNELLIELRKEIKKLPADESLYENILQFNYYILEAELGTIIKELSENMLNVSMRKSLNVYGNIFELTKDVGELIVAHRERVTQWQEELKGIFEKTKNLTLKADIIVENVLFFISELSVIRFHSKVNGVAFEEIEDDVFEKFNRFLDEAIEIYSSLNLYERKLRAESYLAILMNLKGQIEEAQKIVSNISETSNKMNYALVKANLEYPIPMNFDSLLDEAKSLDFNEKWADSSDEEIEAFAQNLLEMLKLPQSRFSNIKRDVIATREINKEKLDWCQFIELYQDLTHTKRKETSYLAEPIYSCHCLKYKISSIFNSSDYQAAIFAFKKNYCENCPYRKPKRS